MSKLAIFKKAYKICDYVSITIANYGRIKSKIALRPRFSFACILHIAEPIILFIITNNAKKYGIGRKKNYLVMLC